MIEEKSSGVLIDLVMMYSGPWTKYSTKRISQETIPLRFYGGGGVGVTVLRSGRGADLRKNYCSSVAGF